MKIIHLAIALPPGEYGTPPVMVEQGHDCHECGSRHDIEACPDCGASIELGFGLLGGGFGDWKVCSKFCGWYWKRVWEDDEE